MSRIILYGPLNAPFTRKVIGALALKKLPYELREPQSPEDYQRWSPETGLLPVLEIDGERTHDSARILDLLDRTFPETPLVATDPKVAQSQRRLEQWAEAAMMFYWIHYLRGLVGAEEDVVPPRPGMRREFEERLDDMVNFLGGRPYFYSDEPSRADLAVWSFLDGIRDAVGPEVAAAVDSRPTLKDHATRLNALIGS